MSVEKERLKQGKKLPWHAPKLTHLSVKNTKGKTSTMADVPAMMTMAASGS